MAVDPHPVQGVISNGNGVLEPGETVRVDPSWKNTLTVRRPSPELPRTSTVPQDRPTRSTTARRTMEPFPAVHHRLQATVLLDDRLRHTPRGPLGRDVHGRPELQFHIQGLDPSRGQQLRRRARVPPLLHLRRDSPSQRRHGRLWRRQLLPRLFRHASADGGFPPEEQARAEPRPSACHRDGVPRRPGRKLRGRLDRRAGPLPDHGRLRQRQLLSQQFRDTRANGRFPSEVTVWLRIHAARVHGRIR